MYSIFFKAGQSSLTVDSNALFRVEQVDSATLGTGNAPPDTITQCICDSQSTRTWETIIENCKVVVKAKGVTFYNFRIGSGSSWQGMQFKDNFQNVTHNANDPITVRRKNREGGGTSVMLPSNIHTVTLENLDRSLAKNATAS